MGSSTSKTIVVHEKCNHDASCQCSVVKMDQKLRETRMEVKQQQPLITQNVSHQLMIKEDSMLLKYKDLQDKATVTRNIQAIFENEPVAVQFLTEAATKMIAAFRSTSEMRELQRWHQVHKVLLFAHIAYYICFCPTFKTQ